MLNLRSSELANAAELRARALPQRLAAVGFMALMLQLAFGWWMVWPGPALPGRQHGGTLVGRRFVSRLDGGHAASGGAYVACVALVSLVYGFLSVPLLLLEHSSDGEVYGVILLAGGLVNLLIVSRASMAAFLATVIPYGGYLLINPFLAVAFGVDEMSWVAVFRRSASVGPYLCRVGPPAQRPDAEAAAARRVRAPSQRERSSPPRQVDLRGHGEPRTAHAALRHHGRGRASAETGLEQA
jgi:hypothetical protein